MLLLVIHVAFYQTSVAMKLVAQLYRVSRALQLVIPLYMYI